MSVADLVGKNRATKQTKIDEDGSMDGWGTMWGGNLLIENCSY